MKPHPQREGAMDSSEICCMPLTDTAQAVRTKKLSPVEIMDAVLHRIEKLNPGVNAYCTLVGDSARKHAAEAETAVMKGEQLGPLHGIPVSIKDLILAGQPTASVPYGWTDDGLPVGLQIVGTRFDDLTVLRAAFAFEQASPWTDRYPALS